MFCLNQLKQRQWVSKGICKWCVIPMAFTVNFDRDGQMSQAISSNDLHTVQQLISSGMSVNSVVHNPDKQENTTILAGACYAGNLDIVDYLLKAGAYINHKDPCYGRTPLHWACIGRQEKVTLYLIKNKADVNCVDRDNVTPIITASMVGCQNIVTSLLKNGANPCAVDRLRASAIHYATFYGHSEVISTLIKSGCNSNNHVIFGQGTPLANLVHIKDQENCKLLLESGYNIDNEEWLSDFQRHQSMANSIASNSTIKTILTWLQTPRSLDSYCRIVIRKCMQGVYLQNRVSNLPVPLTIKNYLLFL
ncbi:26S proteasome non-ATPase regulatory subunit 10 isoform X3 [Octopus bimaculoides]|uniref:SOCS box domain-containing protein n=1 Tax=Octopus bimaculoides TaxID=37653 RepID=A0A0L8GHQ4_OCTBM|nr:26S proteasome non-ATPase regulatory subunit 10 isoform X3 [Octopus bimaculoides]XP_052828054.1 26S proteasome non-ATPase regulatory subunit 10 isoform X3 [Octopus bimaculoides]XP_052828055.1 26S proteasome non-ATPase regulatory subunit 10 isoform X3 [Octopus bimaculoides]XP_052828056.1 26S proteasome non-ATPase regulatory subunit 10 isoform X3 [Octopus bimaculoides]XP_052828057.1 26S proteasome non-ATPase regulatory subunit 10 isoform X3 [Octopus bimaculoides]|eukprot:XP_014780955.1 PREDICTED: 26S proteasome non-ATPase regulatory subunit 10-like isoform X3 [Octopus bimaculoides]